jgi:hypothetical protein
VLRCSYNRRALLQVLSNGELPLEDPALHRRKWIQGAGGEAFTKLVHNLNDADGKAWLHTLDILTGGARAADTTAHPRCKLRCTRTRRGA